MRDETQFYLRPVGATLLWLAIAAQVGQGFQAETASIKRASNTFGPGFHGDDIVTAISRVEKAAPGPKDEYETKAQYEARVNASRSGEKPLIFTLEGSTGELLGSVSGAKFAYDADQGVMTGNIQAENIHRLVSSAPEDPAIILRDVARSMSDYVGSNVFGATARISRSAHKEYGVLLLNTNGLLLESSNLSGSNPITVPHAILTFHMPAEAARSLKANLRFGIVCTVKQPHSVFSALHRFPPAIDDPNDIRVEYKLLTVTLDRLVVFDVRNGNILTEATAGR